jgi:hypothetical protein
VTQIKISRAANESLGAHHLSFFGPFPGASCPPPSRDSTVQWIIPPLQARHRLAIHSALFETPQGSYRDSASGHDSTLVGEQRRRRGLGAGFGAAEPAVFAFARGCGGPKRQPVLWNVILHWRGSWPGSLAPKHGQIFPSFSETPLDKSTAELGHQQAEALMSLCLWKCGTHPRARLGSSSLPYNSRPSCAKCTSSARWS